jgi:hypothetical protein
VGNWGALDVEPMETPIPVSVHQAGVGKAPALGSPGSATGAEPELDQESALMVSLHTDVPEALLKSMRGFIERHPNWDQYRLIQAALAGFLLQQGLQNREVTRCYLANLFPAQAGFRGD